MHRAREEGKHAERESHNEAEEIKIRPQHTPPRAHRCASRYSDRRKLLIRWRRMPAAMLLTNLLILALRATGLQHFRKPLGQTRCAKNFTQQQKRAPRVFYFGNLQQRFAE